MCHVSCVQSLDGKSIVTACKPRRWNPMNGNNSFDWFMRYARKLWIRDARVCEFVVNIGSRYKNQMFFVFTSERSSLGMRELIKTLNCRREMLHVGSIRFNCFEQSSSLFWITREQCGDFGNFMRKPAKRNSVKLYGNEHADQTEQKIQNNNNKQTINGEP